MEYLKRNTTYFLIAVGVVFIWRGVWGLGDLYVFPDSPTLSFIASIVVGVIILLAINPGRNKDIDELV